METLIEEPNALKPSLPVKALLLAVLGVVLVAGLGWYLFTNVVQLPKEKNFPSASFALGFPQLPLYTVSSEGNTFVPVNPVQEESVSLPVVDEVTLGDTTYHILITDPAAYVSQVFKTEKNGARTQLTKSTTYKYGLTVAQDGTAVYLADTIEDPKKLLMPHAWNVTVLRGEKEVVAGTGTQAWITKDGARIYRTSSMELTMSMIDGSASATALTFATSTLVAVDTSVNAVSVFNTVTNAVDLFTSTQGSLGYTQSFALDTSSGVFTALSMYNGDPIATYALSTSGSTKVTFTNLATGKNRIVTVPETIYTPVRVTFLP